MKTSVTILAILLSLNCLAQKVGDLHFHSDLEKMAFESLSNENEFDELSLFLAVDSTTSIADFKTYRNQLLEFKAEEKLAKNPRRLFKRTKKEYFQNYLPYVEMAQTLNKSYFNCVSGSALLAYFLKDEEQKFFLHEMPHHIYLSVKWRQNSFVLESTDPNNGFVRQSNEVAALYEKDTVDESAMFELVSRVYGTKHHEVVVNDTISLTQLAGLNYYNKAVNDINGENYEEAFRLLEKGYYLYQSDRILAAILFSLHQIMSDEIAQNSRSHTRLSQKLSFYKEQSASFSSDQL